MTKTMKLGEKLAADLRAVITSLTALADSIESATPAQTADTPATDESVAKVRSVSTQSDSGEKSIALEQVRAVLADKSRDGFTAQIRELLLKHGADRLSAIEPEKYQVLLEEAEGLSHE